MSVTASRVWPNSDRRVRQVGRRFLQPRNGFRVPDVRWVGVDAVDQRAPQLGLPAQVGVEVVGLAVEPVDEQLRALPGVGGEQPGEPSGHRVAPALPQLLLLVVLEVPEVGGERAAPRLVEAAVDDLEQRPDHRVGRPRVVVDGAGDLGDQRVRAAERDAGADTVGAVAAAEDVGQPLAQPALDALRRHDDEFLGERVGQRVGQQRAETVGKEVGALGTVEMKRHLSSR